MKILLTGADGYLGSTVAARLNALHLPWQPLVGRLDAIAPASLPHTHVIHCAGALRSRPRDWYPSNVHGMNALLQGLCQPARIVLASSRSVYAQATIDTVTDTYLTETSEVGPNDGYGASKLAGELLLRGSHHAGVSCRLSTLYGPSPSGSCPSLPNKAWQSFSDGKPVNLVAEDIEVDYLSVVDAARVLVALLGRDDIAETIINVAGPRQGLHDLIRSLAHSWQAASGKPVQLEYSFPVGPPWHCMDISLLDQLLPDVRAH